jgi:transcription elongation factor GreA
VNEAKHQISAEGLAEAEAELKERTEVKRAEIVAAIKVAREFGDLKENAEYHAARNEQGLNESRIRVLEHHIANAEVVDSPAAGGAADVGSRVVYRDASSGDEAEVTIVHPLESSVPEGKLSVDSPVAKALLGASAGDKVAYATPRGEKKLEVLSVG